MLSGIKKRASTGCSTRSADSALLLPVSVTGEASVLEGRAAPPANDGVPGEGGWDLAPGAAEDAVAAASGCSAAELLARGAAFSAVCRGVSTSEGGDAAAGSCAPSEGGAPSDVRARADAGSLWRLNVGSRKIGRPKRSVRQCSCCREATAHAGAREQVSSDTHTSTNASAKTGWKRESQARTIEKPVQPDRGAERRRVVGTHKEQTTAYAMCICAKSRPLLLTVARRGPP